MGCFQDLVLTYNDLEDYANELHEKVHQLCAQLHPNDQPGAVEMEGGVVLADGGEADEDLEKGAAPPLVPLGGESPVGSGVLGVATNIEG